MIKSYPLQIGYSPFVWKYANQNASGRNNQSEQQNVQLGVVGELNLLNPARRTKHIFLLNRSFKFEKIYCLGCFIHFYSTETVPYPWQPSWFFMKMHQQPKRSCSFVQSFKEKEKIILDKWLELVQDLLLLKETAKIQVTCFHL